MRLHLGPASRGGVLSDEQGVAPPALWRAHKTETHSGGAKGPARSEGPRPGSRNSPTTAERY